MTGVPGAKLARHVDGAGKLIGLHADHADQQGGARFFAPTDDFAHRYLFGGFIEGGHFNVELAEYAPLFEIFGQAMQDVERIARQHAFPKSNQIAVIVVLGRLDQYDVESFDSFMRRHAATLRLVSRCNIFYK